MLCFHTNDTPYYPLVVQVLHPTIFISPMEKRKAEVFSNLCSCIKFNIMICIKIAVTFNQPWQDLLWLRISEHSVQLSLSFQICPFGALLFCINTRHCNIFISSISAEPEGSHSYLIKLFDVINTCFNKILLKH